MILVIIAAVYYLAINIFLFHLMRVDKERAIKHNWRIKESLLFTIAVLGGALGGFAGMYAFRHKNRKPLFYIIYGISLLIHIIIVLYSFKVF